MWQRVMESFRFIVDSADSPGPSTPSSRTWRQRGKSFCLVAVLVLVSGGISAGLSVYMHQCNAPKTKLSSPCPEKKNKTVNIIKENSDEFAHQYKICEIQRTGTYFIYGHVEKRSVKREDSVVLFVKLRRNYNIDKQTLNDSCRTVTFAKKIDLQENSVLYLRFNFGVPDLEKTTFTIFEM